jgi:hypothetical protein
VPFENFDLVEGAANVVTLLDNQDDAFAEIPLGGRTFNFYGTTYGSLFVNTNGLITFGGGTNSAFNSDLTQSPAQAAIAVLWDDWRTDVSLGGATNSSVLYQIDTANNRLIIEWNDVPNLNGGGAATFQAILQLNTGGAPGAVTLNYRDVITANANFDNGRSATVGIKNAGIQGIPISSEVIQGNQMVLLARDGGGPGAGFIRDTRALRFTLDTGTVPAVSARVSITNVQATDQLLVNATRGNDFIELDNALVANSRVGLPATLIGGPGSDTIIDGLGADTLVADSGLRNQADDGVDVLRSTDGTPGDTLIGRQGTDTFETNPNDIIIFTI